MKYFSRLLILSGLILTVPSGAAANAGRTLSWHFAGTDAAYQANPDAILNASSEMGPTGLLKNQIKKRIAGWLPARLGWEDNGWSGGTPFINPLLQELIARESLGYLEGEDIARASWVIALHLNAEEMEKWRKALLVFGRQIKFGEPQKLDVDGLTGWKIPGEKGGKSISFVSEGEWLIVADSFDAHATARSWVARLVKSGHPGETLGESWLKLNVDPEILGWAWTLPVVGDVSGVSASFSWMKENVRMSADVLLKDEFSASREAWLTPKEIIHDPLVSFTAVRGARDWIAEFGAFGALPEGLRPDQLFAWSRGDIAFVNDFAMPVANADKAFAVLSKSVPESYNEQIMEYSLGKWNSATNMSRLLWRGLPVFVPYMGPAKSGNQGYIKGGIFPLVGEEDPTPAPQALFDQIENRDNLMYYDWEISAARIRAFDQATRFVNLVFSQKEKQEKSYAREWMNQISEKLGNAITEATVTDSQQLNIDRKSAIGLTGVELWMLAHWLDGKDFPAFPYNMPKKRAKGPSAREHSLPAAQPVNR